MNSVGMSSKRFKAKSALSAYGQVFLHCVIVVAVVAVGCINNKDGQKLTDSGLAIANSLANYYDTLDQQVDDLVEAEAFNDVLRGLTSSDSQSYQQEMQKTKEALQRRARLARRLALTYQSLKDLSSYDASGEVSGSFDKLGEALAGIPPLNRLSASASATAPVDPSQFVSKGAGLLASWKQSRDIEKAVKGITETLDGLTKLFDHELPACQSITAEHVEKISVLAGELIKKNQVNAWPLLEQGLESIGLQLAQPDQPPNDQAIAGALAEVVHARAIRLQGLANSAGQSLLGGLNGQLTCQRQFQAKKGISVSDVHAAVENANAFLDEIAKGKKSPKR